MKPVIIIGGGLSGAACAYSLSRQNIPVQVWDVRQNSQIEYGVLKPQLTVDFALTDQYHSAGATLTQQVLRRIDPEESIHQPLGVYQCLVNDRLQQRYTRLFQQRSFAPSFARYLSSAQASELLSVPLDMPVCWHQGAVVNISAFCQRLLDQQGIEYRQEYFDLNALSLGSFENYTVILSGGGYDIESAALPDGALKSVAGQYSTLSFLEGDSFGAANSVGGGLLHEGEKRLDSVKRPHGRNSLHRLSAILAHDGYAFPLPDGRLVMGSSFRENADMTTSNLEHKVQWEALIARMPHLLASTPEYSLHVGLRAVTTDHMPCVGPCYHKNTDKPYAQRFMSIGHGARGLASCMLAAELITSMILGTPPPMLRRVRKAIDPVRFYSKRLTKSLR